ncbi:MAG: hypothetical protein U0W40_11865, partial [Acidimicrobiia bacterium]
MTAFRRRFGAAGFAGALVTSTLAIGALAVAPSVPAGAAPVGAELFSYNGTDGTDGSPQTYTVPAGVCSVTIDAYGASSGTDAFDTAGFLTTSVPDDVQAAAFEGKGAHVQSFNIAVTPGETLLVNVGGRGGNGSATADVVDGAAVGSATAGLGGYNGGGDGVDAGATDNSDFVGVAGFAASGGGGGASDVRR